MNGASQLIDSPVLVPARLNHHYLCRYEERGKRIWEDEFDNLVPDAWLTTILNIVYGATSKTAAFYIGLVTSGGTYAAGDSMSNHTGWTEATPYNNASRPTCTWGTASAKSISNSSSAAVFNTTSSATIGGCFLCDNSSKGGTGGTLCGVGNFASGNQSVSNGGTLTVTVTATAA